MASIYNIDFDLLSSRFLNVILNKPKMKAWCSCLVAPLKTVHNDFLDFRRKTNEDLSYNSQTMIFEYLLNKRFNGGNAGIWIENIALAVPPTYIYDISESEPIRPIYYLSELTAENATYTYYLSEFQTKYDFIVHIPITTLNIDTDPITTAEVHAVIKKYKFQGKRYKLINY